MQPKLIGRNQTLEFYDDIPIDSTSNQKHQSYPIHTMQTPPANLPYQDLSYNEKNILDLWVSQDPANIKLAKTFCRTILRTSQKALLEKVGMSNIHERGETFCKLAPMTTFIIKEDDKYPFAGFIQCRLQIDFLRLCTGFEYSAAPVDGDTFFWGLQGLPITRLTMATKGVNRMVVANGLKSLFGLDRLEHISNYELRGQKVFEDLAGLKKLKLLNIIIDVKEICLFVSTISNKTLEGLRIGFDCTREDELAEVTDEQITECLQGLKERIPKTTHFNFNYSAKHSPFCERFHRILNKMHNL